MFYSQDVLVFATIEGKPVGVVATGGVAVKAFDVEFNDSDEVDEGVAPVLATGTVTGLVTSGLSAEVEGDEASVEVAAAAESSVASAGTVWYAKVLPLESTSIIFTTETVATSVI